MIGIVDVFVFIADFLLAVVRLLHRDLLWLKNYFQELTNWDCILFLLLLLVYVVVYKWLMRFGLSLFVWAVRSLLGRLKIPFASIYSFAENATLSNLDYRIAYNQGYSDGEQERIRQEEERRRQEEERRRQEEERRRQVEDRKNSKKWWNPLSWF